MKTIMVMMDTLNRRSLPIYGGKVRTPNIERVAEKSVVFDEHWSGSLPCMPARRDLLTGRTAFLEKGWGGIEPFDETLPEVLREAGIFSHIVTDHYHYFARGGESYCQAFSTWDFHRGQEGDPWNSVIREPEKPDTFYGRIEGQYELNRERFVSEEDFAGPRTMKAACEWLERNKDEDNYFLLVEAFDPHEPFDFPDHYLDLYKDTYEGPRFEWPYYGLKPADLPDEAIAHLNNRYSANLSMIDHWFGKLLDTMDRHQLWEDTLFIFTTDHGFLLGEHEMLGKNQMHVYNELAHIPLMIRPPGGGQQNVRVQGLTQNIDLMPTILDYMGVAIPDKVKGFSLRGLLDGQTEKVRDAAIYGYHGMAVNVTDGRYTYLRSPKATDNHPCYIYTAMPTTFRSFLGKEQPQNIEAGRFLPYTEYPVFRFPVSSEGQNYGGTHQVMQTMLFDIQKDYNQETPLQDQEIEAKMIDLLKQEMQRLDSPQEQYVRLGLTAELE
ncbi:sulfatase [Paenibacillus favisporus]|uniref:sulfatase n=1 Tax=Paenibacillus favisporus TaxID=221028 RepID=UPI003D2CF0C1